ncbi:hypothetical protein NEIG_00805 [Nematocida sp. ERTm5]|nr:hypothetical protein NEIG_00805 [Nematocida sp. ERTm5]
MENIHGIVQLILNEEVSGAEIEMALSTIKKEEYTIPELLIQDYLRIKNRELRLESIGYTSKKEEISRIIEECTEYLTAMIELNKNKEIALSDRMATLIEKTVSSHYIIGREEKIYLAQEKEKIKSALNYQPSISTALIYISVLILSRIEMIKIEKSILDLPQDTLDSTSYSSTPRPISVNKITNPNHSIRITGHTTTEDIQNMLRRDNSYTMTIEQYGERMMKMMEEQGISLKPSTLSMEEPQDTDILTDLDTVITSDADKEIERQNKEKDESIYGDGNRIGRK